MVRRCARRRQRALVPGARGQEARQPRHAFGEPRVVGREAPAHEAFALRAEIHARRDAHVRVLQRVAATSEHQTTAKFFLGKMYYRLEILEEALALFPKIKTWKQVRGKNPDIRSDDPAEKRLAAALLFLQKLAAQRKAEKRATEMGEGA